MEFRLSGIFRLHAGHYIFNVVARSLDSGRGQNARIHSPTSVGISVIRAFIVSLCWPRKGRNQLAGKYCHLWVVIGIEALPPRCGDPLPPSTRIRLPFPQANVCQPTPQTGKAWSEAIESY